MAEQADERAERRRYLGLEILAKSRLNIVAPIDIDIDIDIDIEDDPPALTA